MLGCLHDHEASQKTTARAPPHLPHQNCEQQVALTTILTFASCLTEHRPVVCHLCTYPEALLSPGSNLLTAERRLHYPSKHRARLQYVHCKMHLRPRLHSAWQASFCRLQAFCGALAPSLPVPATCLASEAQGDMHSVRSGVTLRCCAL